MISPAYPAARVAAARVHDHFTQHLPGAAPDAASVETVIEAAFWASLRREEGYLPRISLAWAAPEALRSPLMFERRLPLGAHTLTKLAPAVERPGIHLGVWRDGEEFYIWGATRDLPPFTFVLEVIAPGLLVVKHSRGERAQKFVNVAVLQGDEVKVIDRQPARSPDCPALLASLLEFEVPHGSGESANVLLPLAVSMRAHGRGGSLLVVPSKCGRWRKSLAQPVLYALDPPFSALAQLVQSPARINRNRQWTDAMQRAIDGVAGLTAVDGATVISDRFEVFAFGAKIVRLDGSPHVAAVMLTEPVEGTAAAVVEPTQLGGTRHLSAAQFVHDQRDAIALVASQDGRFTVFAWSPCENIVHAHRMETLLL
jgi:hypothetical protein